MFEAGFFSPDQIANGHGDVAFDSAPCGDDEGSIDWGDDTITSDFQLKHTYAYNGSFKVHIRCEPTGAFFSEKYVTSANEMCIRDRGRARAGDGFRRSSNPRCRDEPGRAIQARPRLAASAVSRELDTGG